jgi:GT2 family glycosyltransferase
LSIGVVIPVGPGRQENLTAVLRCLAAQSSRPAGIVVVQDGFDADADWQGPIVTLACAKHEPGREQPRNVGVRALLAQWPDTTHVWFLDSDVQVGPRCLEDLASALETGKQDRIVVGPYDWLGPGERPTPGSEYRGLRNDPRWASFDRYPPHVALTDDLAAGLACFSGNLLWPIAEFVRVGGFWSELHHGRCEDGELGLRAVAMGVPISFAAAARGWHLWHEVNTGLVLERNARDVPLINDRHPWLHGTDVFMVDRDGAAFDVRCSKCRAQVATNGWWAHAERCGVTPALRAA